MQGLFCLTCLNTEACILTETIENSFIIVNSKIGQYEVSNEAQFKI